MAGRLVLAWTNWRAALGELVLIVVGILAALAVDAWWDRRQDAATEASYLRQLSADLDANEPTIKMFLDQHGAARDAATRLASHFDAPGRLPGCDTLAELVMTALSWVSLDLRTGTYAALLATGDIGLIRNSVLRGEVIRYAGVVDGIKMHLAQDVPQGWSASQVFRRRVTFFWRLFEPRQPSDPPLWSGCNFEPFRRDVEVREALFTMQLLHDNRVEAVKSLADANANLQSQLRDEPAGTSGRAEAQPTQEKK